MLKIEWIKKFQKIYTEAYCVPREITILANETINYVHGFSVISEKRNVTAASGVNGTFEKSGSSIWTKNIGKSLQKTLTSM